MLALITDPSAWAALFTLTALEIILGVDNVIFLSLLAAGLEPTASRRARQIGLFLALIFRIALLFGLTYLGRLRTPLIVIHDNEITWRDVVLIGGGLFLITKAIVEIHNEIDAGGGSEAKPPRGWRSSLALVILQIAVIDLVFSIDSILTAIGMAQNVEVMIAAVIIAVAVMYVASEPVAGFIMRHPTTKMLALSFLILIGVALIADGFDVHIPRGYVYFAMAFAAIVEGFNIMARQRRKRRSQ
jgi:predicted tellurium resistance membrane protein TerC